MDSLDYEGSLAEMGSLLAQGRLLWHDKAKFYVRVSGRKKARNGLNSLVMRCWFLLSGPFGVVRSSCACVLARRRLFLLCFWGLNLPKQGLCVTWGCFGEGLVDVSPFCTERTEINQARSLPTLQRSAGI